MLKQRKSENNNAKKHIQQYNGSQMYKIFLCWLYCFRIELDSRVLPAKSGSCWCPDKSCSWSIGYMFTNRCYGGNSYRYRCSHCHTITRRFNFNDITTMDLQPE